MASYGQKLIQMSIEKVLVVNYLPSNMTNMAEICEFMYLKFWTIIKLNFSKRLECTNNVPVLDFD